MYLIHIKVKQALDSATLLATLYGDTSHLVRDLLLFFLLALLNSICSCLPFVTMDFILGVWRAIMMTGTA
jgi:hypothetical protein